MITYYNALYLRKHLRFVCLSACALPSNSRKYFFTVSKLMYFALIYCRVFRIENGLERLNSPCVGKHQRILIH